MNRVKERGVSNVIGNILMILITFLVTIMVLFYVFSIMPASRNNANEYLYGILDEYGENVSVMITHGSISTPFMLVLKSASYNFARTVTKIQNVSYLNGTYDSTNFSIQIINLNHNNLLDAGDIIYFKNMSAQELSIFSLIIIYDNNIVLDMSL